MAGAGLDGGVEVVRGFNRFWTRQIGVLEEGYLESPFTLTEVRVLYELAYGARTTASELGGELGLDAGYLSRILRGFEGRGLISKRTSEADGRRSLLAVTQKGREALAPLERRSREEIGAMLAGLSAEERGRLVRAMRAIEGMLGGRSGPAAGASCGLRGPLPGDMGWVVGRHGSLYAREYGWDARFEALVARIVADFAGGHDPRRERCWIAEGDGERAGCVFLVEESEKVAKLRLLLVEPGARGAGLGRRLVDECVGFARGAGYARITLWTNDVLRAAVRIYEGAGFRLVAEEPHRSFGHDLVGQTWELRL